MASAGRFISFEGIDGSGKSTQARILADRLRDLGHSVVLTREPGGSPGAEEIRRLVLEGDPDRWSAETEVLLFTAARRDHLEKTIRPALEAGSIVITDRFADSTRIYQGITRGDLRGTVDALHDLMIGTDPDLTLLIDIDPGVGLTRAVARAGKELRFEDMGVDLQRQMRAGFLDLAVRTPRIQLIDGAGGADHVAGLVWACVAAHLGLAR
jgi:dTMP kinase